MSYEASFLTSLRKIYCEISVHCIYDSISPLIWLQILSLLTVNSDNVNSMQKTNRLCYIYPSGASFTFDKQNKIEFHIILQHWPVDPTRPRYGSEWPVMQRARTSAVTVMTRLQAYSDWSYGKVKRKHPGCRRDHFLYAPSEWEKSLQCNTVSHWLNECIYWSMHFVR